MAEYLFIALAEQDSEAAWVVLDGNGRLLGRPVRGPVESARAAAQNRRVVLLVPAPDVVTTQAALPAASAARLRQMLPYSLEESFAEDVEQLVFATGPRFPSGSVSVSVVSKRRLEGWLSALTAAGIHPQAAYSEAEGVPDTPSTLTLIIQGDRVHGRRPGQPPFVFEGIGLEQMLDLLRGGDESADLRHVLVYADEAGSARYQAELLKLQAETASADVKLMADGMLPRLAATLVHSPGSNLLQGSYAPKSNWRPLLEAWRLAAGLAVASALIALLGQGVGYWSLLREDRALAETVRASCARLVSSDRIPVCEAEVEQRLRAAGETPERRGEGFLTTLAAVAVSGNPQGRIEALSYRNRVMDLQLIAPSVSALDEFARKLDETQKFVTSIESASQNESGVEGRIKIVGAAR